MEQQPENKPEKAWDWKEYYEVLGEKPHTSYLETAVRDFCKEKGEALDVGAGNLRDTKYLLEQGFTVTAVDPSPVSREIGVSLQSERLMVQSEPIGKIDFPEEYFSLINAQGILFHFAEPRFGFVLEKLKKSLKKGGVFCANFIGINDDWADHENKTIVTKEALEQMFIGFDIKILEESEIDELEEFAQKKAQYKGDPDYKPKHWHLLRVVAVKK